MSSRESAMSVQQQLRSQRTVVLAMGAALPIVGVIGLGILPSVEFDPMHLVIAVAISGATALLSFLLSNNIIQPIDRNEANPVQAGVARLQSATMTQAAIAEAGGLVLFVLAFVFELSAIAVLVGMVLSAVAVFAITWPTRERLRRVRRRLERDGASCPIDELAERRV